MAAAKQGDTVHVHYTGKLDDGTVFDSSKGKAPLAFVLGTGHVIPGFEKAVEGMTVGDEVSTRIAPEDAYGLRSDELVLDVPSENFPEAAAPAVGDRFEMSTPDGQKIPVTVTAVADETVQIDANHPLAGEQLNFDLELVKID
ncbi:MAG: peptidylprolyl isomerase [Gemmatimonadetes bacterium]|nr:peptidylprolyl isomerase [Gemmatimonadota bacterium]